MQNNIMTMTLFTSLQKVLLSTKNCKISNLSDVYAATILKGMESVGYTLSIEAITALRTLSEEEAETFYSDLMSLIKEATGANKKWEPMYPNFPTQVMAMEEAELYLNAMMHYLGDWLGVRIVPKTDKKTRIPLIDKSKLKTISLATQDDLNEMLGNLMKSKTSLSKQQTELLEWGINNVDDLNIPEITFKETLAFVYGILILTGRITPAKASEAFKTATDVLRLTVALSDGDISLATPTRFRSFKRSERRFLLNLLEIIANKSGIVEDMMRYKNVWVKLGERLHPFEKKYKSLVKTCHAFWAVRQNVKLKTFNSKVEKGFEDKSENELLLLLASRGGEFARRLDHLLRTFDDSSKVFAAFREAIDTVSSTVLLQVLNHFTYRHFSYYDDIKEETVIVYPNSDVKDEDQLRVFLPKGNMAKIQAIKNELPPLPKHVCDDVVKMCKNALIRQYAGKSDLGKVYVDPQLKDYIVPFSQRADSNGLRLVSRGTKLPIPDGNTLRFFCWWKDCAEGRVDIDLSATLYDEKWDQLGHISYTNLKDENVNSCHSGDITSAPKGASEFIDIDIESALEHNIRYVTMSVYSFSAQPFQKIPEAFCGWMSRSHPNSGEIFNAKTVQDKMDLVGEAKMYIPLVFDLKTRKVTYADMPVTSSTNGNTNLESNLSTLALMGNAITNWKKMDLHTLFTLHAKARGALVDNPAYADTVFSVNRGITPFDTDKIIGEFI